MKDKLIRWIKLLLGLGMLFIAYMLLDFSFNLPEPVNYQFKVPELTLNEPVTLKQGNMMIIVARYSDTFLQRLNAAEKQRLVDENGYFVVHGYGTHLGCPLIIAQDVLKESCSDAAYNLAGQSQNAGLYVDLKKVDYTFSQNHTVLTIN